MKVNVVRTRYAPSPTGYFHIGGARTALFNFLYAKANNGIFIVRIEDTDVDRNVDDGAKSQLENLKWLKIFPDESYINPGLYGPYIQSEKLSRYKELVDKLLSEGKAYRCFCTHEELEKERLARIEKGEPPKYSKKCSSLSESTIQRKLESKIPYSIRLNLQENKNYSWNDIIRGKISFNTSSMSDIVILKSNGIPTYNFAVVVDDYDMKISHVLRGEEHISNTPYQLAIKEALNFNNEIEYGHLSIIVDDEGKKLSKRNQELKQFIEDYKKMGFPEVAITNFLCLLGWSRSDNKEIFSLMDAIKEFDIHNLSSSPTTFDYKKMLWVSSQYFKEMDEKKYLSFVEEFIEINNKRFNEVKKDCLLLFKNQISYASQLNELILELLEEKEPNIIYIKSSNLFLNPSVIKIIHELNFNLEKLDVWSYESIQNILKRLQQKTELKGKDFFLPIRYAVSLSSHGPELYKVIYILGKQKVLSNTNKVLSKLVSILNDDIDSTEY